MRSLIYACMSEPQNRILFKDSRPYISIQYTAGWRLELRPVPLSIALEPECRHSNTPI